MTLSYHVPPDQDPAVIRAALGRAGHEASTDPTDTQVVHVAVPADDARARDEVRALIASVHTTAIDAGVPFEPGPVRFLDEG